MDVNDGVLRSLHLELCCSENKIGNLFNDGFAHRKQPKLADDYISEVGKNVKKGKVGLATHQNQWRFPINKERNGVATDFSLKGGAGKNILSRSDQIIHVALQYHSGEYRKEWQEVLQKYGDLLEYLNPRYDFTEDDIREFQKLDDDYSEKWASLMGREGQTNYEHFI